MEKPKIYAVILVSEMTNTVLFTWRFLRLWGC